MSEDVETGATSPGEVRVKPNKDCGCSSVKKMLTLAALGTLVVGTIFVGSILGTQNNGGSTQDSDEVSDPTASPTALPSSVNTTMSVSPSVSWSSSLTPPATPTASCSPSGTSSESASSSGSPSNSGTTTPTHSASHSESATSTGTQTPTQTRSSTHSQTATSSATKSQTITPSATPTGTPSAPPSASATPSQPAGPVTASSTASATATPSQTASATPSPSYVVAAEFTSPATNDIPPDECFAALTEGNAASVSANSDTRTLRAEIVFATEVLDGSCITDGVAFSGSTGTITGTAVAIEQTLNDFEFIVDSANLPSDDDDARACFNNAVTLYDDTTNAELDTGNIEICGHMSA